MGVCVASESDSVSHLAVVDSGTARCGASLLCTPVLSYVLVTRVVDPRHALFVYSYALRTDTNGSLLYAARTQISRRLSSSIFWSSQVVTMELALRWLGR